MFRSIFLASAFLTSHAAAQCAMASSRSAEALGCPLPTDSCMNEASYEACVSVVEAGCSKVEILESCPLSFGCADSSGTRKLANRKSGACVTLYEYDDDQCSGEVKRTISLPTYARPGSSCFQDVLTPNVSVNDQYCNPETGNWHELIHVGSEDCRDSWWNLWSPNKPTEQIYTKDGCIGGLKLKSCELTACPDVDEEDLKTWRTRSYILERSARAIIPEQVEDQLLSS